jgi:[acyl-carrier-protein] S-malonyltransferase
MLQVSAPFHCSLMKPAQDRLQKDLGAIQFHDLDMPLIANVDARPKRKAEESRDALVRQATGSVRWEESMRTLIELGVQTFLDVGHGGVLCGLMRQIDRAQTCFKIEDEGSLQKAINHIGQHKTDPD